MFEDLELPEMEKKKLRVTEVEAFKKLLGYQKKGIRTRLSKRKTLENKIKRRKALERRSNQPIEKNDFNFINDDLVYRRLVKDIELHSNAVIFCIMDTSGSMDQVKKYLARSFYFLLYQFLNIRYEKIEIKFISHHIEAQEVSEDDFFHRAESGGTNISSGYIKTLNIIEQKYPPSLWNIYTFHCSDGDNFESDNLLAVQKAKELAEISNLFGYGEIKPESSYSWSSMIERYQKIDANNFICLKIKDKSDIWPAFQSFMKMDSPKNTVSNE